jgi:O-antigen/teichoic acid export membrane protein
MRTAATFSIGVGTFCITIVLFGELAMTSIYGPSFSGTHLAVTLLALGVLTNSFAIVAGNGLWAVDRPQANLIADATVLLVTLGAAALLIHPYGILGAASATLIGSAAGAITRFIVFRRVLRNAVAIAFTN